MSPGGWPIAIALAIVLIKKISTVFWLWLCGLGSWQWHWMCIVDQVVLWQLVFESMISFKVIFCVVLVSIFGPWSTKVSGWSDSLSHLCRFPPTSSILWTAGPLCFPCQDLYGSIEIPCIPLCGIDIPLQSVLPSSLVVSCWEKHFINGQI